MSINFYSDDLLDHYIQNKYGDGKAFLGTPIDDSWKKGLNVINIGHKQPCYEHELFAIIRFFNHYFLYSKNLSSKVCQDIISKFKIEEEDPDRRPRVREWTMSEVGPISSLVNFEIPNSLIDDDVYPEINITKLAEQFMTAPDKILVLTGAPGTGKSTFIRHLIKNYCDEHVMHYTKDLQVMVSDSFWKTDEDDIILLDDYDLPLNERNEIMTRILTSSNGVFTEGPRIVITTNQKITDIDPALLRPGRCFDVIEMKPMCREQAHGLWCKKFNLKDEDFQNVFRDVDKITSADLMINVIKANKNELSRLYWKDGPRTYNIQDVYTDG